MKQEPIKTPSFVQRFFIAVFPRRWAQAMEADSRRWFMKCLECGFEQSYWNLGGIRWGARGDQRNYQRCARCGIRSWHRSYKKDLPP